jgi:hypothetical protein
MDGSTMRGGAKKWNRGRGMEHIQRKTRVTWKNIERHGTYSEKN